MNITEKEKYYFETRETFYQSLLIVFMPLGDKELKIGSAHEKKLLVDTAQIILSKFHHVAFREIQKSIKNIIELDGEMSILFEIKNQKIIFKYAQIKEKLQGGLFSTEKPTKIEKMDFSLN